MSLIMTITANGEEVTAEDVREWIGDPPSPNAFGAVFMAACRSGLIVKTGYRQSKRKERRAGLVGVYKRP